jgi:hypothetical protein
MRARRVALLLLIGLLLAAGCSSGRSNSSAPPTAPAPRASSSPGTAGNTLWLCRPGQPNNPCDINLDATVVQPGGGTSREVFHPAQSPKVDCFYVYPTVSAAKTTLAPMAVTPELVTTVRVQAARFASVCRLFAPVYRQITVRGLLQRASPAEQATVYGDVLSAWNDYLAHDNDGRGVVLLGHSQGSFSLTALLANEIEKKPDELRRLVSALLIGGQVNVPPGKDVGGSFARTPACRRADQTACVVAFNSFGSEPPADSRFAHAPAGRQVLCVNPAALAGGAADTRNYFATSVLGGFFAPPPGGFDTAFASYPGAIRAQCEARDGASWLNISVQPVPGASAPQLVPALGPTWGLHTYDMNVAMGNLIDLVARQGSAWHG